MALYIHGVAETKVVARGVLSYLEGPQVTDLSFGTNEQQLQTQSSPCTPFRRRSDMSE